MSAETTQALLDVARLVAAGVVGALAVSLFNHLFTRSRERQSGRENRKREFRSFVVQFFAEAQKHYPTGRDFLHFYMNKVPALRHGAANIEGDFRGAQRAEFERLVDAASTIQGIVDADYMKRVRHSLDDILAFLNSKG